ncbi:MAG: sodium/solute symporter [Paraglaciecola sp.]|nr:sodium/solute symporter [Paraglaciecola sp.]
MNYVDYLIVFTYLVGLLVLGFVLRNQQNKDDYFLAGRTLGWKPLTLSIMATQLSAVSFISAPAFVGLREGGGLIWLSYELAVPFAMLLLLWLVLPTLHSSGVISVYDFLERRFDRSSRLLISLVFQISRSFATAIMIYAISIILQSTIGLAFWQSVLCIGIITLIYSLQGGMKAVVYGDAIQMIFIILGALTCLGFGLYHIGGWNQFVALVEPSRLQTLNIDTAGFNGSDFGLLPMLFGGFILYASYYGCDQSEAQRSLAAKNPVELKKMIMTASFLRFPITLIYCFAGLVIGTLASTQADFLAKIPQQHPDWMMPIFIVNYLPHGIIGLLLVAILAAAMSSLSSAVNSLAAVSVEDYCRYRNKQLSNHQYLRYAKISGACWGLATLLLSFYAGDIAPTIIEAINKVGSVFYGPVLAMFLLAILTKKLSARHVNTGLLVGVLSNIALWLLVKELFWFWWNVVGFVFTVSVSYCAYFLRPQQPETLKVQRHPSVLNKRDVCFMLLWFAIIMVACYVIPNLIEQT